MKKLFLADDPLTGGILMFFDEIHMQAFNGWVYDRYPEGGLMMEAQVKNGRFDGLQKHYYACGKLEQTDEMKENTLCGISKEYYKSGQVRAESIVIRNSHVKIIYYDEYGHVSGRYDMTRTDPTFNVSLERELQDYAHLTLGKGEAFVLT